MPKTKIQTSKFGIPNRKSPVTSTNTVVASYSTGLRPRHSHRLQQLKITESWSGKKKPSTYKDDLWKNTISDVCVGNEIEVAPVESAPQTVKTTKKSAILELSREEKLQTLKNFDLEGLYGACRGITRRERFERAQFFKLKPIPDQTILDILDAHKQDAEFEHCIWDCNELLRIKIGSPIKH